MDNPFCKNAAARINQEGNPFGGNATLFVNSDNIEKIHQNVPRFGHTSDINALIDANSSNSEKRDYVVGILAAAIGVFVFFGFWILLLLVLKCLGYKRVGFFSGERIRKPMPPSPLEQIEKIDADAIEEEDRREIAEENPASEEDLEDEVLASEEENAANENNEVEATESNEDPSTTLDQTSYEKEMAEWQENVRLAEKRQRRVRLVVIFSCLAIVICAILMCVKGAESLSDSVDDGRFGLFQVGDLARGASKIIDDFFLKQDRSQNQTSQMLEYLNGFCPGVRSEICQDIGAGSGCNFRGLPLEDEIAQLISFLNGTRELVYSELTGFQSDLDEIVEMSEWLNEKSDTLDWAFWLAAAFAIALGTLCLLIVYGVILAWREKLNESCFRHLRNIVVVPLFAFLVMMSLLFSCVFMIGSTATADVCYDSPDTKLLDILYRHEDSFGTAVFDFATFYIGGCPEEVVPLNMDTKASVYLSFVGTVTSTINELQQQGQSLRDICDISDADLGVLEASTEVVSEQLCILTTTLLDVRDFFVCDNWHALYETIMYNAVCFNGTDGFHYIAITQFVIVFFSMVILTLRVACYETADEEEAEKHRQCFLRWCGCTCCCKSQKVDPDQDVNEEDIARIDTAVAEEGALPSSIKDHGEGKQDGEETPE